MNLSVMTLLTLCLAVAPRLALASELQEAQAAFDRKDYDLALTSINDTLKGNGGSHTAAYEMRAIVQAYRGRPEEALADYDLVVKAAKGEHSLLLRRIALGVLTHLLSHDQELVRAAAASALAELGPRGTESI